MASDVRIRVMIVDDHSILRAGLKQSGEFEVVGQAGDGEEAVRVAAEVSPKVVVMDVRMPRKDGVEACREIMEVSPDTPVVMLTASTEEDPVVEAVAAGATASRRRRTGSVCSQPCGTSHRVNSVCPYFSSPAFGSQFLGNNASLSEKSSGMRKLRVSSMARLSKRQIDGTLEIAEVFGECSTSLGRSLHPCAAFCLNEFLYRVDVPGILQLA